MPGPHRVVHMPTRPAASDLVARCVAEFEVRRNIRAVLAATAVLLCAAALLLAYANKARCAGAPFDADGRSVLFDMIKDSDVCYSDIQFLWLGRDINEHVFPYIGGGITTDGTLVGGAV